MWPAIIAAGAALASSAMSNSQSEKNTKYSVDKQIEWNREAMQNKHQYEVEDLKAAGLNPILSANSGGSIPSISASPAQVFPPDFNPAVNAYSASNLRKLQETQQQKNTAEVQAIRAEVEKRRIENERLRMQLEQLKNNPELVELQQISDSPWKLIPYAMRRIFGETNSAKAYNQHFRYSDSR